MITTLVAKLPFIAKLTGIVAKRSRLFIEYALIAVIVTTAGLSFTMWLSKERTEKALAEAQMDLEIMQGRVTTLEVINNQQEATITELKTLRTKDAQALRGLINDYEYLVQSDAVAKGRLEALEKMDESVREFLDHRIPTDLACLLNNACPTASGNEGIDENRATPPARSTDGKLPGAGAPSDTDDKGSN